MAFHVERLRSAGGEWNPDYDDHPEGIVAWDSTEAAAIKTYGRRVLGSEEKLKEGDVFTVYPLGDAKTVHIAKRSLSLKFAEGDPEDA